jgi:hypothetical protein
MPSQKCEEHQFVKYIFISAKGIEENAIKKRQSKWKIYCSGKYKLPPLIFHWKITAETF